MCNKLKVASVAPKLYVGNVSKNCDEIFNILNKIKNDNVDVVVFPELCLSGYTCGDLFFQQALIDACWDAVNHIVEYSSDFPSHIVIGSPINYNGYLYDCGIHIFKGEIIQITSKNHLSANEKRWFSTGYKVINQAPLFDLIIGDDIYLNKYSSNIIVNISAVPALVTGYNYHKEFVKEYTRKQNCAYVYASAGSNESTTDYVYSGACLHANNGEIISEGKRFSFENEIIYSEITISPSLDNSSPILIKKYTTNESDPHPFIPSDKYELAVRCEEILEIQSTGLAKRMLHINCNKIVLGISGGLDSTHALLVAVETMKKLQYPIDNIVCITMPGFGTTDLTYTNACNLVIALGATLKEINIKNACLQHFNDIGHDVNIHDVTYENTQARERTQILMDYANKIGGLLVGTGDLSELALGWCTYNGDHMSMYGVNASVPKTLMQHLVRYVADKSDKNTAKILYSVLDTPISPELLPPDKNGKMEQKTESTLGPYEVHDYYLYHFVRFARKPADLLKMANIAFKDVYTEDELNNWLKIFIKRFFNNQFKRSCLPDGPAVGSVSLSPRSAFVMPSDACYDEWLKF